MRIALLFFIVASCLPSSASGQATAGRIPIAKIEVGAGFSPFGMGNGLSGRAAVAFFPTRLGVIARFTSHTSAKGTKARHLSFASPEKRIVDRAVMLAGHVETEIDAVFTVALGVGQLWGERLNSEKNGFVPFEQRIGLASEIGAYMPTRHSGLGTVVMANVTTDGFVVGFVLTFFVGI